MDHRRDASEDTTDVAPSGETWGSVAQFSSSRPYIQDLLAIGVNLIPGIGGALGAAVTAYSNAAGRKVAAMQATRLRWMLEELEAGKLDPSDDVVQSEDFIHNSRRVVECVLHTRRRDKIRLFARLLSSSQTKFQNQPEQFEEFLFLLDRISVRQLCILLTLETVEVESREQQRHVVSAAHWQEFQARVEAKYGITRETLGAILSVLIGSGLYEATVGIGLDEEGAKGRLTPLFPEFKKWLQVKEGEIGVDGD